MWSPDLVMARWKISVDLFSRIFLADGPGAERESFLAARAGVAGRLARYSIVTNIKFLVTILLPNQMSR